MPTANLAWVQSFARQIQTRDQALQLLIETTQTANEIADRTTELPWVNAGSQAAIVDGVSGVLSYVDRVRSELNDPIDDRDRQRVALAVDQMNSWLQFVDREVKSSNNFAVEFLKAVQDIIAGTLKKVADAGGDILNKALTSIPWYLYAGAAAILIVVGVVAVKGAKT